MLKKLTLKIGAPKEEEIIPSKEITSKKLKLNDKENEVMVSFIQKMKSFNTRKWSHSETDIFTTSTKIELKCWNRTIDDVNKEVSNSSITDIANSSTEILAPQQPQQTFVCPYRNCHKIFNSRTNWKRHQTLHRKKEEAANTAAAINEEVLVNVDSDSPPSISPLPSMTTSTSSSPPNKIKLVLNMNKNK